jgi:cytochrome c-type biogenesis protein CcmE
VTVLYTGSVSDQFRAGREVSVKGELRSGTFVAIKDSLVTKCPSKYTAKKST